MEYIQQQQQSQAEQQEQEVAAEMQFRDREIAVKEQQNQLDFIVDMTKINQMSEKDDKKMAQDFAELSMDDKHAVMDFIIELIKIANEERVAEIEQETKEVEMKAKALQATQQIEHKEAQHQQSMRHTDEKNKQALAAAKQKGASNGGTLRGQPRPKGGKAKPKTKNA
jgi:hypothetical protein